MLTETPEIIIDTCACCGNEIQQGQEDCARFPGNGNLFCDLECLNEMQIQEGNVEICVAGDDTARVVRRFRK